MTEDLNETADAARVDSEQRFAPMIFKISPETPDAYVFLLQASTDGAALTLGQLEAARNAAMSVLELVGANVASSSSILHLEKRFLDAPARLVLEAKVEGLL